MSVRSWRINQATCCAIGLYALMGMSNAAETNPQDDSRGLKEVRTLTALPRELAKLVGWEASDKDRISDLERGTGTAGSTLSNRWFLLGGLSSTYALIAIEERSPVPPARRIHANGFSFVGSKWVSIGEWMLSSRPHTVDELVQLLQTPESQALTAQWQKWQRERDLQRRMMESEPTRSYRRIAPFRENNINDEEVRQIQAVVRELIPGAIVMISGVAKGCPCEDGPDCSAQVWTAVHLPGQTRSLELSDINEHWVIGPVQRWFLESEKIQRNKYSTYSDYSAAQAAWNDQYPTCADGQSDTH
jgi:hypothetical protein